jgi:SAM-dependent methyltransferase
MYQKVKAFLIRTKHSINQILNKNLIKIKTALLFGNVADCYFCPCCGKHCTDWSDWSSTYRNVVCPNCDSQPRHRLFSLYLKERTDFEHKNLKVLHFAPERILRKQFSSMPNLDYTTADLNDSSVDIKIDITEIPYADNTFDVIFCSHVLEHVPNDRKAMSELARVLKPGGWAYLQVPLDRKREKTFEDPNIVSPEDRLRYYWQEDHVRLYGLDYKDRLEQTGFIVTIDKCIQQPSPKQIKKYGLRTGEDLYFVIKPTEVAE